MRRLSDAGFTLLEVLVAFALLAVAFGVLLEAFGGALKGAARTDEMRIATALARTTLAATGAEIPLEAGERRGTSANGLAWHVHMVRHGDPRAEMPVAAYEIAVTVSWHDGSATRSFRLRTLRLTPKRGADGA